MNPGIHTKRLIFYWTTSFILATAGYYILRFIMPDHYVFGLLYRMFLYHWEHPVMFILIPCFFYGIIATLLSGSFAKQGMTGQILLTILIILVTVLLSSPAGGMLWHYYDMKAGWFPEYWFTKMVKYGTSWGLETGWYIIALSIPYNISGSVICYFLTRKGSHIG